MAFQDFPPLPPTPPRCRLPPPSLPSPPPLGSHLNLPVIEIGAIVGIGLLLLFLYLVCCRRKGEEPRNADEPRSTNEPRNADELPKANEQLEILTVESSVCRHCGYNTVPTHICYNCGYRYNVPSAPPIYY